MLKFHKLFNIQNKILIFYNDEIILKNYNKKLKIWEKGHDYEYFYNNEIIGKIK